MALNKKLIDDVDKKKQAQTNSSPSSNVGGSSSNKIQTTNVGTSSAFKGNNNSWQNLLDQQQGKSKTTRTTRAGQVQNNTNTQQNQPLTSSNRNTNPNANKLPMNPDAKLSKQITGSMSTVGNTPSATQSIKSVPSAQVEERWYRGENPTWAEMQARVIQTQGGNTQLMSAVNESMLDATSPIYNPYIQATSKALKILEENSEFTFDRNGVTDEWLDQHQKLKEFYVTSDTGNSPVYGGKKSASTQKAGAAYEDLLEQAKTTRQAETEAKALQEYIQYWAKRSDRNMSPEEIISNIKWKDYPTLSKMREGAKLGVPVQLVRPVACTDDVLYGYAWAAMNNGGSGNIYDDAIYYAMGTGNRWTANEEISSKLNPESKDYSPFSVGSTLDEEGQYFGVDKFDQKWIDENRSCINCGDATRERYYKNVVEAEETTTKAEQELQQLYEQLDSMLEYGSTDPSDILTDDLLDDYPTLRKLDKAMNSGAHVGTTRAIDYRYQDIVDYVGKHIQSPEEQKEERKGFLDHVFENLGLSSDKEIESTSAINANRDVLIRQNGKTVMMNGTAVEQKIWKYASAYDYDGFVRGLLKANAQGRIDTEEGFKDIHDAVGEYSAQNWGDASHVKRKYEQASSRLSEIQKELDRIQTIDTSNLSDEEQKQLEDYTNALRVDMTQQNDILNRYQSQYEQARQTVNNISLGYHASHDISESNYNEATPREITALNCLDYFHQDEYKPTHFGAYAVLANAYGNDKATKDMALVDMRQSRDVYKQQLAMIEYLEKQIDELGLGVNNETAQNLAREKTRLQQNLEEMDYFALRYNDDFEETVSKIKGDISSQISDYAKYMTEHPIVGGMQSFFGNFSDSFKSQNDPSTMYDPKAIMYSSKQDGGWYTYEATPENGGLLNDSEKDTYLYLYSTKGADAANEYFNLLMDEDRDGYGQQYINNTVTQMITDWVGQNGYTGMMGFVGKSLAGISQLEGVGYIAHCYMTGKEVNPYSKWFVPQNTISSVTAETKDMFASLGGKEGEFGYQALGILYDIGSAAMDSYVNSMYAGALGLNTLFTAAEGAGKFAKFAVDAGNSFTGAALMGSYSFASTYQDVMIKTGSADKALAMASISFLAETATEAIELDKIYEAMELGKGAKGIRELMVNLGQSMSSEAVGEGLGQIVEGVSDELIMQEQSQWHQNRDAYIAQGYSVEEAKRMATVDFWKDVGYAAFLGGMSGGLSSGISFVGGKVVAGNRQTNENTEDAKKTGTEKSNTTTSENTNNANNGESNLNDEAKEIVKQFSGENPLTPSEGEQSETSKDTENKEKGESNLTEEADAIVKQFSGKESLTPAEEGQQAESEQAEPAEQPAEGEQGTEQPTPESNQEETPQEPQQPKEKQLSDMTDDELAEEFDSLVEKAQSMSEDESESDESEKLIKRLSDVQVEQGIREQARKIIEQAGESYGRAAELIHQEMERVNRREEVIVPIYNKWIRQERIYINDQQKAEIESRTGMRYNQWAIKNGIKLTQNKSKATATLDGGFMQELAEVYRGEFEYDEYHPEEAFINLVEERRNLRSERAAAQMALEEFQEKRSNFEKSDEGKSLKEKLTKAVMMLTRAWGTGNSTMGAGTLSALIASEAKATTADGRTIDVDDAISRAESNAAAINLMDKYGNTQALLKIRELLVQAYNNAADGNRVNISDILKIAALGKGKTAAVMDGIFQEDHMVEYDDITALQKAMQTDMGNQDVQQAIKVAATEYAVGAEVKNAIAHGALAAVDPYREAENKARSAMHIATENSESATAARETAGQNLITLNQEFQADPKNTALAGDLAHATANVEGKAIVEQQMRQSAEMKKADLDNAVKAREEVEAREMNRIREEAQQRVAQQFAEAEQNRNQMAVEQQQNEQAEAERKENIRVYNNVAQMDAEDYVSLKYPNATGEERQRLIDMYKEEHAKAEQERQNQLAIDEEIEQQKRNAEESRKMQRVMRFADRMRQKFGVDIEFANYESEYREQGYHDKNHVVINLRYATQSDVVAHVLLHELTHQAEQSDKYNEFRDALIDIVYKGNRQQFEADAHMKGELYRTRLKQTQEQFSDDDAQREIVADMTRKVLFSDDDTLEQLVAKKPSVARRILSGIKSFLNRMRGVNDPAIDQLQKARQRFEKALLDAKKQSDNTSQRRYELNVVDPVVPSQDENGNTLWTPGHSEQWFRDQGYPIFRDVIPEVAEANETPEDTSKGHGTQIEGTRSTYEKIFNDIKAKNPTNWQDIKILDASSGLGLGTRLGREMGFQVDDIEPYPSKERYMQFDKIYGVEPKGKYAPMYTDYSLLENQVKNGETDQYDYIISNAVLNVIPQDTRDNLTVAMGHLLKPGGTMFVNVINKSYDGALKSKPEIQYKTSKSGRDVPVGYVRTQEGDYSTKGDVTGRGHEMYVWKSNSVQKVFAYNELKSYLSDALGSDYSFSRASFGMTGIFATKSENAVDGTLINTTVNGTTSKQYSLSSWTEEERERVRENLYNQKPSEMDEAAWRSKVDKWIDDVDSVASTIANDRDRLDYKAAPDQTMLKNNAEYVKTLDASTLCAKRLLYQGTFNAIQHLLPNTVLTSDDVIKIREMMREAGYESPCAVCYVESRRRNLGEFTKKWLAKYKEEHANDGSFIPKMDDLTTTDGLRNLYEEHLDVYQAYVDGMNRTGSNNPKVVQLRTDYRGEIRNLTPSQIAKIIEIGGLRIQSFSDFETPHLIDMMQAVLDMYAMGLTGQAYTKVPAMAWVFGGTGIKINLSLISGGTGLNPDGTLAFSSYEGMDIDEAMKIREAYPENVGTILVGQNDAHILVAMADPRIDYIIPFHKSGWGKKQLAQLSGMTSYMDYTKFQNERRIVGKTRTGRDKVKKVQENFHPVDYWDPNLSGKENAQKYLDMCFNDGRIPKFDRFLVKNADGSYSLQPDGSTDGYWKLLIDYKMYDNNGNFAPQQSVKPNFNMEYAQKILNEYDGTPNSLKQAHDVVERFVSEYKEEHPRRQYSLSEDENVLPSEDLLRQEMRDHARKAMTPQSVADQQAEANKQQPKIPKYDVEVDADAEAQKIVNRIALQDDGGKKKMTMEEFETTWFDYTRPAVKMTEARQKAEGKRTYQSSKDVRDLMLAKDTMIGHMLDRNITGSMVDPYGNEVYNVKTGKKYGAFSEITKKIPKGSEQEFNAFWLAVNDLDRAKRNLSVLANGDTTTVEGVAATVEKFNKEHPEWIKVINEAEDWVRQFMQTWLVDEGLIRQSTLDKFRDTYPYYIPAFRTTSSSDEARMTLAGQDNRIKADKLKRASNDKVEKIYNPVMAMVENVQRYIAAQKQAEVLRALDDFFQSGYGEDLEIGELVDNPESKNPMREINSDPARALESMSEFRYITNKGGEQIINVPLKDGTVRSYKMYDNGIFDCITSVTPNDTSRFLKALAKITGFLCANATSRKLSFTVQNFLSDGETAMNTGNNRGITWLYPVYQIWRIAAATDLLKNNILDMMGKETSERYKQYQLFGGLGSRYSLRENKKASDFRDKMYSSEGKIKDLHTKWNQNRVETMQDLFQKAATIWLVPVEKIADFLEGATRYNEFIHGGHDLSTYDGLLKAGKASREATGDFTKHGSASELRGLKCIIPFIGAQMQGVYKTMRMFSSENAGRRAKIASHIVINSLFSAGVLAALRHLLMDDEEKEAYAQMSDYEKARYCHIKIPGMGVIKAKRSQDGLIGFASQVAEFIVDNTTGWEQNDFGDFRNACFQVAESMIFNHDTVLEPIIDAANNRTWSGARIDDASYDKVAVVDRYDANTPELYKSISIAANGAGLEISPNGVGYVVGQYTGSAGKLAIGTITEVKSGKATFGSVLNLFSDEILGGFSYDPVYSSYATSEFYDSLDMMQGVIDTADKGNVSSYLNKHLTPAQQRSALKQVETMMGKGGTLNACKKQLKELWKRYNAIGSSPKLSDKEKKEQQRLVRAQINKVAVGGNQIMAEFWEEYGYPQYGSSAAGNFLTMIDRINPF